MKSDAQLRQEITNARRLLRERRKQRWGTATDETKSRKRRIRPRHHTETFTRKGHEFLYGQAAHTRRRIELFRRAGGELYIELDGDGDFICIATAQPAICEICETGHQVTWEDGHWIHMEKRHCDCMECGRYGCKPGHSKLHHNRIKWD